MGKNDEKTNVMRLLEQKGISYNSYCYVEANETVGVKVAALLHQDPDQVFKTLVTRGKSGQHYVFVIPVGATLELRKAAKVVGEKSIEMIPQKELLPLTGYIHGGCSPIGMKKTFPTVVQEDAQLYETIFFSAGKVGYQVEVKPSDLEEMVALSYADVI